MNIRRLSLLLAIVLLGGFSARAQDSSTAEDSLGLPGDNLDLAGVLELFKKAESLEAFEKALNEESNQVNNLDLNNDDKTDYIRVVDEMQNDTHAIILQVPVSATESQDVALIAIEKNGAESAQLQIIGDEELYGENYIVEPQEETEKRTKGPSPELGIEYPAPIIIVNVWGWPGIRWVYAPRYVRWVSPWRWAYYPPWWRPWRPVMWRVHHHHCMTHYHPYYRHAHTVRVVHAHGHYHGHVHRTHSAVVHNHYAPHHARYQANHPRGRGQQGGGNGNVKARDRGTGQATGRQQQGNKGGVNKQKSGQKASPKSGGGHKQGGAPKGGRGGGGGKRK
ncbi:MAG: hypothetical protein FD123_2766 [Bacteroidetes bacterium]|nr:MAG: hypothetical protein FD123_2766 [Bacteroidota bacterium]